MRTIMEACQPRGDILQGTCNPEIFTASLSQVMDCYRGRSSISHSLYTDGEQFFSQGTYATEGLRLVLADVFGRVMGRGSPAIHRLETAFGGGKTHILIALAHLGFRGSELASVAQGVLDPALLPAPGEVCVVGVAGDEIPVHKPQGTRLVPYTLWGEIAYQIGGENLYRSVEQEAASYAAPSKDFLDQVLLGRKVIIMLDELAQYATRLEAARPNGSEQLGAFLMALHGYARNRTGIAVVLTLASQADAFARQTAMLTKIISSVRGEDISSDEALGLAQRAEAASRSVVARDASTVVPVRAGEISRVLAKRLFDSIDGSAAEEAASAYMDMYSKSGANLPERAVRPDFHGVLAAHYPFHPSFIDFLNQKLATLETFQGTRGVLRVLALTVRSLWNKKPRIPMVHSCHIDLRDPRTLDEVIGRTGSGDLLPIVNADIGGPDTSKLEAGRSQAELADRKNPHPEGFPLHEYTWKTVFLHSLVGRSQGLGSNLFGITEKDALFEIAFPGMTPPQVETALKEIKDSAYYLRLDQGRYFASLEPSINIILAQIRRIITAEQAMEMLSAAARKTVAGGTGTFHIEHDVSAPEHVPDNKNQPILAMITLDAREIDPEAFITTVGPNRPRIQQNHVFLLVPNTVHVKGEIWNEDRVRRMAETLNRLQDLARWVMAMRRLKEKPEDYGVHPSKLSDMDFQTRQKERELALQTALAQTYDGVWFPSASGQIVHKDIKTGGGEGGFSILEEFRRILLSESELISADRAQTREMLQALTGLFFEASQTPTVASIKENFSCKRDWPVLDQPALLFTIIREGVIRGQWCLFKMGGPESLKPETIYGQNLGSLPLDLDLNAPGWSIVTVQGARQRGWIGEFLDPSRIEQWVVATLAQDQNDYVSNVVKKVQEEHGDIPRDKIMESLENVVRAGKLMTYSGAPDQTAKPETLTYGERAVVHKIKEEDVVITPQQAALKGWTKVTRNVLTLTGKDGTDVLLPLLPRLGSIFGRGGLSTIKTLDFSDLELPEGGRLRLSLEEAPPESMKRLGELFEVLGTVIKQTDDSSVFLEIEEPDEACPFVREVRKKEK